jgi:hypothetical protein
MRADIIAENQNGIPILVVEVKSRLRSDIEKPQLVEWLSNLDVVPPFAMIVDPQYIRVFRWDGKHLEETVRLSAREIFTRYDDAFGSRRIFEPYLASLAEAWLRDLAYHWKSVQPPGRDELQSSGLLEQLAGGTTKREVEVRGAALH